MTLLGLDTTPRNFGGGALKVSKRDGLGSQRCLPLVEPGADVKLTRRMKGAWKPGMSASGGAGCGRETYPWFMGGGTSCEYHWH